MAIEIPCKFYIKIYFENNCGIPADLSIFPDLLTKLKSSFRISSTPNRRLATIYDPETITILIPEEWSFGDEHFLSYWDRKSFVLALESKLKCIMREYIASNISFGRSLASSIRDFQEEFCLPENVWPYESIKKDCDRHGFKRICKKNIQKAFTDFNFLVNY
jgi:hypothetical protein